MRTQKHKVPKSSEKKRDIKKSSFRLLTLFGYFFVENLQTKCNTKMIFVLCIVHAKYKAAIQ